MDCCTVSCVDTCTVRSTVTSCQCQCGVYEHVWILVLSVLQSPVACVNVECMNMCGYLYCPFYGHQLPVSMGSV